MTVAKARWIIFIVHVQRSNSVCNSFRYIRMKMLIVARAARACIPGISNSPAFEPVRKTATNTISTAEKRPILSGFPSNFCCILSTPLLFITALVAQSYIGFHAFHRRIRFYVFTRLAYCVIPAKWRSLRNPVCDQTRSSFFVNQI